jgi:hypothetical protein
MLEVVVRVLLAGVLLASAGLKLADPRAAEAGLATFRVPARLARPALLAVALLEAALAVALAAGWPLAPYVASGLMLAFAAALASALVGGRTGAPCGCFGARSRVGRGSLARALALAAAFAVLPALPGQGATTEQWLALGLALALAGVAALGVALVALAREVGLLRLRVPPEVALDIPEEGPELGSRPVALPRLGGAGATLGLAVFTSENCRMCRALEPAVAIFARDPRVALLTFDEALDAQVWRALDVPGSPYAVALDGEGAVTAKGTFNTFGQLEAIVAAGERRAREPARA